VLEFTLVHLGWAFRPDYQFLLGQVIWAIGWSMVLLAGLVLLPTWVVGLIGVLIIAGHNAFDQVNPASFGSFRWLWVALVSGGPVELRSGLQLPAIRPLFYSAVTVKQPIILIVAYPILPWLGVMAAGYAFGMAWLLDPMRRRRWLLGLGVGITALFVVLRYVNRYGDPRPWSHQDDDWFTVLSFVNCTKYPPSLLFVLMTLGPAIMSLAWFDRGTGPLGRPLVVFGRVPLFYYLLHVHVIHVLAFAFAYFRYGDVRFLVQHPFFRGHEPYPSDYGYDLPVVYLAWIIVIAVLYPACWWFARLKGRRRDSWLSYL